MITLARTHRAHPDRMFTPSQTVQKHVLDDALGFGIAAPHTGLEGMFTTR